MLELAKQLFGGLKEAAQAVQSAMPGLQNIVPDAKAEFSRIVSHGSTELASGLYHGSGFVQYGPGVQTPVPDHDTSSVAEHMSKQEGPQQEQERGGMER